MYGIHEFLILKLVEQRLNEDRVQNAIHVREARREREPRRRRVSSFIVKARRRILLRLAPGH